MLSFRGIGSRVKNNAGIGQRALHYGLGIGNRVINAGNSVTKSIDNSAFGSYANMIPQYQAAKGALATGGAVIKNLDMLGGALGDVHSGKFDKIAKNPRSSIERTVRKAKKELYS